MAMSDGTRIYIWGYCSEYELINDGGLVGNELRDSPYDVLGAMVTWFKHQEHGDPVDATDNYDGWMMIIVAGIILPVFYPSFIGDYHNPTTRIERNDRGILNMT